MTIEKAVEGIWISVGLLWVVSAVIAKHAKQLQSRKSRRVQVALTLAGFFFMFSRMSEFGILAWRFVPRTLAVEETGLLLTALGCLFAIWARVTIGRNWSASVATKRDHRLITSGPYAVVRHPIYSGLLFALTGTAIVYGEGRDLLAVILITLGWWPKMQVERPLCPMNSEENISNIGSISRL